MTLAKLEGDVAVLENSRSRVLFSIVCCAFFRDRPSRKLKSSRHFAGKQIVDKFMEN